MNRMGIRVVAALALLLAFGLAAYAQQTHGAPAAAAPPATIFPERAHLRREERFAVGARQIKLAAGGGVLSPFDPLDDAAVRLMAVMNGTDKAYRLAKKYRIKTAWGSDILLAPEVAPHQNRQLVALTRWCTPAEILKMATADNAELCALSGPRNPYPAKNFVVVMKNGKICKDLSAK
jgi:imidazolonepropionase-like amidohydrolase